ncbi:MAG: DEAD/DEAH box helicase [Steroidobacteraceae bacterium]
MGDILRDYQIDLDTRIDCAFDEGARNVMATAATGSGKGTLIGHRMLKLNAPGCVLAHRSYLVSQLALTLNREQVPHGIIAPKEVIREIIALEVETHGRHYYRATAPVRVGSVLTVKGRDGKDRWYDQVREVVVDEGHHVIKGSSWEAALAMFENARGLFKTAHALRGDGKGLGRKADGLVDTLVVGPCLRDLIERGFNCDYDIACPPSDIDISDIPVGASGELIQKTLRERIHASKRLVGDIVSQYIAKAGGKLGLTFVVDIEEAHKTAAEYRKRGVPTEIITEDTSIAARSSIMKRYRSRQLLQLVSVDVLSEGVDVPAVEVISCGRHTESFQLFSQQVGRGSRPSISDPQQWARWNNVADETRRAWIAASDKPRFLILDHVGNFNRMYLKRGTTFDCRQAYTLGRVERRRKVPSDAIPMRTCLNDGVTNPDGTPRIPPGESCFKPYPAIFLKCPHCGTLKPAPEGRGSPDKVEGDLVMLDTSVLRAMQFEVRRIDGPVEIPKGVSPIVGAAIAKNHHLRQIAQGSLRKAVALWAGWQQQCHGLGDREIHTLFWHRFAVDVLTAQTLNAKDAAALEERIREALTRNNIVEA